MRQPDLFRTRGSLQRGPHHWPEGAAEAEAHLGDPPAAHFMESVARSDAGLHPDRDLCLSMRFRRPRNDELSILLSFFHVEEAMKKLTLAVALLALLGTTAMAQQTSQSQPTGRTGVSGSNATINSGGMTSINSGGMTSSGMRDSTTGMNARSGPERGSPDGSPATAPQTTTGPNGQPSNNETLPK